MQSALNAGLALNEITKMQATLSIVLHRVRHNPGKQNCARFAIGERKYASPDEQVRALDRRRLIPTLLLLGLAAWWHIHLNIVAIKRIAKNVTGRGPGIAQC